MKAADSQVIRTGMTACFYLSGAAGLIYQVLWIRLLIPVTGAALHAVSAVLAAFMAGLALGGWLGGRWSDASHLSALRAYAVLELLIAGLAGGVSYLLPLIGNLEEGRLPLAFLLLLLPTLAMGATLPVAAKLVTEELGLLGERVGQLYSANTSGAVMGAVAAGSFLVPLWGIQNALFLGVGSNLLAALGATLLPGQSVARVEKVAGSQSTRWSRSVTLAYGFSGTLALAYEVVWTRSLSGILGTSTYAFSTMLVVFLVGIAAGSGLMASRVDQVECLEHMFGKLLIMSGVAGLIGGFAIDYLPRCLFAAGPHLKGFGSYLLFQTFLAGLILLPQTLTFGAIFPVAVKLVTPSLERLGNDLGQAYFANTVGGIVGSLLAGFWLVPTLGARVAGVLLAALGCLLGAAWSGWIRQRRVAGVGLVLATVCLLLCFREDDFKGNLYASYAVPQVLRASSFQAHQARLDEVEVLESHHGLHCDVVVSREGGATSLSLDGWIVASTVAGDTFIQKALGHFPLLLARETSNILVVGLGTGITASAAQDLSLSSLTVVELEPAVVHASRQFSPWSDGVFENPAVSIVVGDGRQHIARTEQRFDIITSDPIHPFSRGSASLYTVEHFRNCAKKLKPGGVMIQWLPLYGLSKADAQIVVASFLEAFPNASYWSWYPTGNREDGLLVGGVEEIDLSRLQSRFNQLGQRGPWGSPEEVLSGYLMEGEALRRWVEGVPLNTDDRPLLEFTAPVSLYRRSEESATQVAREILERSGASLPRVEGLDPGQVEKLAEWFRRNGRPAKSQRLLGVDYR